MSDIVGDHLLLGQPLLAVEAGRASLREGESVAARVGLVRALVWLVRPLEAAKTAELLPDTEEAAVGRALARLASGEPGRARGVFLEHPPRDVLGSLTAAEICRAAGDAVEAVEHAARGRALARDTPGWQGFAALTLGRTLADVQDPAVGARVLEEALRVFERELPGTVCVAEALDALGNVSRRLDDHGRAITYHRQAIEVWEAALGPAAGNLAGSFYGLAQALHRTRAFADALEVMQKAYLHTHRSLGPEHIDTWITRFELGRLEVDTGEMLDGFPRMEAARAEVCRRLGRQHPVVRAMDVWL